MNSMNNENISILQARGITKRFPGVNALEKVDFHLTPGRVHALMGENGAGKSTLMKIIAGIYQADEGEIFLHGEKVVFSTPKQALNSGIAMIHQELSPVLNMTIAENIFLGKEFLKGKSRYIDYKKMNEKAAELLESIGVNLKPTLLMKELSVSQMQMIEIAKALSFNSEIIIMDEPTATITDREVTHLFDVIRKLKEEGRCIVYITHKMDEVFTIADEITVFRDGQYIGTYDAKEITEEELIRHMVNRELTEIYPERKSQLGEIKLKVNNLCQNGVFENMSFEVRAGEILGFSGLMGAGRTEVMNAIFGITKLTSGEVYVKGEQVTKLTPKKIISRGVGYVTEDRKGNGLVLSMGVQDNIILSSLNRLSNVFGRVKHKKAYKESKEYAEMLSIKTPSLSQLVKHLSGGNQQKVVLAKWLMVSPDILVFDEPTRGIDVGAKTEIYRLIAKLAEQGKAIIFISSEMPEILGMCDRIIVLHKGKKMGELMREEANQEKLLSYAAGL